MSIFSLLPGSGREGSIETSRNSSCDVPLVHEYSSFLIMLALTKFNQVRVFGNLKCEFIFKRKIFDGLTWFSSSK